jgi:hypothetical protein
MEKIESTNHPDYRGKPSFFLGQRTSKQQAKLIQQRKARRVRISIG